MPIEETRRVMEEYTTGTRPFTEVVAEDAVFIDKRTGEEHRGHAELAAMFESTYRQMFEADAEPIVTVAGDEWFAVEYRMSGRHEGQFAGVPGTGRQFTTEFAVFYRVASGKIVEAHVYFPSEPVLRQVLG